MSRLGNAISSIFRKGEKRISSEQFEQAVNEVLLSDTVADAVKKNIITPDDEVVYRLSNGDLLLSWPW